MLEPNKPVRVFRNWKRGCYSVMQTGLVRLNVREVLLSGVQFIVRESGRQRLLHSGRKNVHAYAQGMLVDYVHPDDDRSLGQLAGRQALYNALTSATFVDRESGVAIFTAPLAQLDGNGLTYTIEALEQQNLAA